MQENSKELPIPSCPVLSWQHKHITSGDAVQGELHRMQSRLYISEAFYNKKGIKYSLFTIKVFTEMCLQIIPLDQINLTRNYSIYLQKKPWMQG